MLIKLYKLWKTTNYFDNLGIYNGVVLPDAECELFQEVYYKEQKNGIGNKKG